MGNITLISIALAVIIIALALIIVAVWVGSLSRRIRNISEAVERISLEGMGDGAPIDSHVPVEVDIDDSKNVMPKRTGSDEAASEAETTASLMARSAHGARARSDHEANSIATRSLGRSAQGDKSEEPSIVRAHEPADDPDASARSSSAERPKRGDAAPERSRQSSGHPEGRGMRRSSDGDRGQYGASSQNGRKPAAVSRTRTESQITSRTNRVAEEAASSDVVDEYSYEHYGKGAGGRTSKDIPVSASPGSSGFFEGYNQDVESRSEAHFGRRGPVIPFGEDKTIAPVKPDYSEAAIGFETDPDTVDFSRVAGYRRLRRNR